MKILVRHDGTIHGSEQLTAMAEATIEDALRRFSDHITTVECHFADENHAGEIRCSLEVRFEGKKPIGCTQHGTDLPVALEAAAETMARMLDHQLGRIRDGLGAPERTS
ncbi:HPF/RaiA family ribosome-associated protein [soil metagenome]